MEQGKSEFGKMYLSWMFDWVLNLPLIEREMNNIFYCWKRKDSASTSIDPKVPIGNP